MSERMKPFMGCTCPPLAPGSFERGHRENCPLNARASEDAKDKEIERLKADNAGLLEIIRGLTKGPVGPAIVAAHDVLSGEQPHPGTAILEELTRLRATEAHQAELLRLAGLSSFGKDATIREQREEIERLRARVEELQRNRDSADQVAALAESKPE